MAEEIRHLEEEIAKLKKEHSLGGRLIQEADRYRTLSKIEDRIQTVKNNKDSLTKSVEELQQKLFDSGLHVRDRQNELNEEQQKLWLKFWEQCKTKLTILEPHW